MYVFQSFGHCVGGLDLSKEFKTFARECIRCCDLDHCEALDVPIAPKYDYIFFSNSINLFPSIEYVCQTLSKSVQKMNNGILITEANDLDFKKEYKAVFANN